MKIAIVDDRSADRERLAGLAVSYLHKKNYMRIFYAMQTVKVFSGNLGG